jgi:hypothetical protein
MADKLKKLRVYNIVVGLILLAEGWFMWALSNGTKVAVKTSYLKWAPLLKRPITHIENVGDVRLGPLVAMFLLLSALFLLGNAFVWNKQYNAMLEKGMNLFRWMEYSITSSLMIVVIAMLCGVYDLSMLILIFALNACMILFGWVMEVHNQTTQKVDWTAFIFGCFAGLVPWVVMGMYFFAAIGSNASAVPPFVYGIFWSLLVAFNIFAINMVLQYKKVGKWKDYINGEWAYVTLSLVAKSLLAWLVWGGTLR